MAETQLKRQREESHEAATSGFDDTDSKRHKSYDNILSILDDEEEEEAEEEEPNKDFSAIFTTLQQELSSSFVSPPPCTADEAGLDHSQTTSAECSPSSGGGAKEYEDDDSVRVMIRRLLEASDDELGIPNRVDEEIKSEENRQFDGLWELEDEAANYYTMLQKDLSI